MYSWKFLTTSGLCLLGTGEMIPSDFGFVIQFGALGILAVAVWRLLDELREARKERISHEKIRHEDHAELNRTLISMTQNCSAVNARKHIEIEDD